MDCEGGESFAGHAPRPASPSDDPDAALMLAAAGGDDAAFAAIVGKFQRPLMNFFHRMGVNMVDAEELAQLTFIKLYRSRKSYRPSAKFTTWLYLLARQVRVDDVRSRIRGERLRRGLKAEEEAFEAAPRQSPQFGLRDDLQRALDSLDAAHRDVVVLGMVQELPYDEVSGILGIPVGTVKSRMHNALKRLREFLEK